MSRKPISLRKVFDQHSIKDEIIDRYPFLVRPFKKIAVILGTVTRKTSWNDIPGLGLAATRYRNYMVPSCGWCATICALSIKIFCEHFLRFRGDWRNFTLPGMSVFSPFCAVYSIVCVTLPVVFIPMKSTKPPHNLLRIFPFVASTAIRKAFFSLASDESFAHSFPGASVLAGNTRRRKPITASDIFEKLTGHFPRLAFCTPLQTRVYSPEIFLKGYA